MTHTGYFDAHLNAEGLSFTDMRSMAEFGVKGALVVAGGEVCLTAKERVDHLENLVRVQAKRLLRAGIRPYVALGVHPTRIPWQGVEKILAAIPRLASSGRLVAIGETGLYQAGPREEQVFQMHLELAMELNLPIIAYTPEREKPRIVRRICGMLKESGIRPERVLVSHSDESALRTIRECGHYAGLTVHPGQQTAQGVVSLIKRHGSERVVVVSGAGNGAHDILALPLTAVIFEKKGLSQSILRRTMWENPRRFLRL